MSIRHVFFLSFLALLSTGCGKNPAVDANEDHTEYDLTYLLERLNDVSDFAKPPAGTAHMISTFDQTGGNNDFKTWTATEPDGLITLARIEGPGYITRFWNTGIAADQWYYFIDDETDARLSGVSSEIYRDGTKMPFIKPITDLVSGGAITYLPIPFEKSIRIAASTTSLAATRRRYWHINYVQLPPNSKVSSFPKELSPAEITAINDAATKWADMDGQLIETIASAGDGETIEIPPAEAIDIFKQEQAGQLTAFTITLERTMQSPQERSQVLRELILRVFYDGKDTPSIEAPIGDFFGNAFHTRQYSSLPLGNIDNTFVCRFPMPFANSMRMEITNDGDKPAKLTATFKTGTQPTENLRYLHASWNGEASRGGVTRQFPFKVVRTKGKGHYVGAYVNAISTDSSWFILEGDEQIRLDGSYTPRLHGTGLEDYFNGGWYYTGLYDYPLAGLVEKAPIRTGQYRLHLPDRIGFESEFNMSLEFGDANRSAGYMSSVAYWYLDQPAELSARVPPLDRRGVPPDPKEAGAIMGHLFELEREDLFSEARERCEYHATKFPQPQIADTMELRAIAYSQLEEGYEAVAPLYEAFISAATHGPARVHATWLNNMHKLNDFSIVGIQAGGQYSCYIDGKPVSSAAPKPTDLTARFYTLPPGKHTITVEITPTPYEAFYSMFVMHKLTNIVTDAAWECSPVRPADWPNANDDKIEWKPVPRLTNGDMLPRQGLWQMPLNAFVDVQSSRQMLRPWREFAEEKKRGHAYLRHTFVIPPENTNP